MSARCPTCGQEVKPGPLSLESEKFATVQALSQYSVQRLPIPQVVIGIKRIIAERGTERGTRKWLCDNLGISKSYMTFLYRAATLLSEEVLEHWKNAERPLTKEVMTRVTLAGDPDEAYWAACERARRSTA